MSQLRQNLREAVEQVKAGKEIEIVQNGVIVAALVHPERLRPRVMTPNIAAADALAVQLEAARNRVRRDGLKLCSEGTHPERAEELIQDVDQQRVAGE
ncbi:type II toxin-antitoxin system prevent-host-death family antitoxin [Deinococcus aestuarii]|uniref:type II toxin-antitoxin system prevent-host-death family antitoxin n=1 Tax=Deinococcus aestuarii TaxID=2774531 RepID=UPI0031B89CA9